MILFSFILPLVFLFSVCWHATGSSSCVKTYSEFEYATINANPDNVNALVGTFFRPNRPSPILVHVIYHINWTNTSISATGCSPEKEMWLWVPSPVFMFLEPNKLNQWALYTLNFFNSWSNTRRVHIYVPMICNFDHDAFNFLNDFTSKVSSYSMTINMYTTCSQWRSYILHLLHNGECSKVHNIFENV